MQQKTEYECTLEEFKRGWLKKSGKCKPIYLNFCKNWGFEPPRAYQNIGEKSWMDKTSQS